MTEKRFYIDKSGDLYDKQNNELLMLDFGYAEAMYVNSVLTILNQLHEENEELKERVKQLQIDNTVLNKRDDTLIHEQLQNKKNYLHNKPQVWFTQSAKLTDKQIQKVAEAIEQDLKERRIKE